MSVRSLNSNSNRPKSIFDPDRKTLMERNSIYYVKLLTPQNPSLNMHKIQKPRVSQKQEFQQTVYLPILHGIQNEVSLQHDKEDLDRQQSSFETTMFKFLEKNEINKAIETIDEEIVESPRITIIRAFKESNMYKQLLSESNNGEIVENGITYNLKRDDDIHAFLNKDIDIKEKFYDQEGTKNYNKRQIKYLFSSLIQRKYEETMKPQFEKNIQREINSKLSPDQAHKKKELIKKSRKLDLTNTDQVKEYYKQSHTLLYNIDQDQEVRNRIIEFARQLEILQKRDYEKERHTFNLTYKFGKQAYLDEIQEVPENRKSLQKFLNQNQPHFEIVDHSDQYGRGLDYNDKNKKNKDDDILIKDKTTFNKMVDVDRYYLVDDNYKDNVPFDLYNMVSLSKRIDFKKKLDLELRDMTKEIIKNQLDQQNELQTIEDLSKKHLLHKYNEEIFEGKEKFDKNKRKKRFNISQKPYTIRDSKSHTSLGKYNKWYIQGNERFIQEISHNRQPGPRIFDPKRMKSPEDLKDSGFVPYYKFGKLNKEDLKIDPSLSKDNTVC